jgi:hypothetical protein
VQVFRAAIVGMLDKVARVVATVFGNKSIVGEKLFSFLKSVNLFD